MQNTNPQATFTQVEVYTVPSLKHPAEDQSSHLLLHALARLHDAPIRREIETLAGRPQPLDVAALLAANDLSQSSDVDVDSALRFADHAHLSQDRLALPVLQSEPESPRSDITLRYRFDSVNFVIGDRMAEKDVRRRRRRAAADDGGNVAGVLQCQRKFQMQLGVRNGRKTETSFGGIV